MQFLIKYLEIFNIMAIWNLYKLYIIYSIRIIIVHVTGLSRRMPRTGIRMEKHMKSRQGTGRKTVSPAAADRLLPFRDETGCSEALQRFARPGGRGLGRGGTGMRRRMSAIRGTIFSPTFSRALTSAAPAEREKAGGSPPTARRISRNGMVAMARWRAHCWRGMTLPARVVRGTTCRAGTFRHHASLHSSGAGRREHPFPPFPVAAILMDVSEKTPNSIAKNRVNCGKGRFSVPPRPRQCHNRGTAPASKRARLPAHWSERPVSCAPSSCGDSPSAQQCRE